MEFIHIFYRNYLDMVKKFQIFQTTSKLMSNFIPLLLQTNISYTRGMIRQRKYHQELIET